MKIIIFHMATADKCDSYLPATWLGSKWFSKRFFEGKIHRMVCEKDQWRLTWRKRARRYWGEVRTSTLKPLHASWVCDLYDYLTSSKGEVIIKNGWERAGIIEAIEKGLSELPPLGPFQSIDPLVDQAD